MTEADIVCVLGMHRSGTSLLTKVLNILGVALGPEEHLMPATKFNPRGFWEHEPLVKINDELLRRFGGTWRNLPALPVGWEGSPDLRDLADQARAIIQTDFGAAPLWGWKDPRACVTLPFWQRLLGPMKYLVCLRNPVDVAHSLEHTMPFAHGAWLWFAYLREVLIHTLGRSRLLVFYEDFIAEPERELRRIATFIGRIEAAGESTVREQARQFVSSDLHHHRTPDSEAARDPRLRPEARALFMKLRLRASLTRLRFEHSLLPPPEIADCA